MKKNIVEANRLKLQMYQIIKRRRGTTSVELSEAMELPVYKVQNYLATLLDGGYLSRKPQKRNGKFQYIASDKPFKLEVNAEADVASSELPQVKETSPPHIRVHRIADQTEHKTPKTKRRTVVHIGSGMTLFNNH